MKINQTAWAVERQELRLESRHNAAPSSSRSQLSTINPQLAFTLIELLVVITIIGVLAAFLFTVAGGVKKRQYISQTQAEMGKLESAIEGYKNQYGFYPRSNPNYPGSAVDAMFSPLYFELLGTTNNGGTYQTLDGSASITGNNANIALGVAGFVNCTKGAGEDASPAKSFLSGLKPSQFYTASNGAPATILLGSAGGPDPTYSPLNGLPGLNPWRYVSPGVNNPGSYDLWMQLVIGGKTNLVCNWSKQVQINFPLP